MRCKITISYRIKQEKTRLSKNHVTLNSAKNLNVQTYGLQILHFVQNDTYLTGVIRTLDKYQVFLTHYSAYMASISAA